MIELDEPETYADPLDSPSDPDNLLAATDPLHDFGPDGRCECGVHESRGWVPCDPEDEVSARIDWNEIIGLHWRLTGDARPTPHAAAPPLSRVKPKREPPPPPVRSRAAAPQC